MSLINVFALPIIDPKRGNAAAFRPCRINYAPGGLKETLINSEFPACLPQAGDTRMCRPRYNNLAVTEVVPIPLLWRGARQGGVVEPRLGGYGRPALSPHTGHPVHKPAAEISPGWTYSELPKIHRHGRLKQRHFRGRRPRAGCARRVPGIFRPPPRRS